MWLYITGAMHSAEWESYTAFCLLALIKLSRNAWIPDGPTKKGQGENKKSNKGLEVRVTQIDGLLLKTARSSTLCRSGYIHT